MQTVSHKYIISQYLLTEENWLSCVMERWGSGCRGPPSFLQDTVMGRSPESTMQEIWVLPPSCNSPRK